MTISLLYEGRLLSNWTSASATRSLDALSGTFEFTLSPVDETAFGFPVTKFSAGDEVKVLIDGQLFLTGAIDKREDRGNSTSASLTLSGRSKTRDAIDSSASTKTGEFNDVEPDKILSDLGQENGIRVKNEAGKSEKLKKHRVFESETTARSMRRVAREAGLNLTDDEEGNILIFDPGKAGSGSPLILGQNILEYSVTQDWSKRVKKVTAKGQSVSTDQRYGKDATDLASNAIDSFVKQQRSLRVLTDNDADKEKLKKRAIAEASRRAGESLSVSIEVAGHSDTLSGSFWKVNKTHSVSIPRADIQTTLLLKEVKFSEDANKSSTSLTLTPKKAYSSGEKSDKKSSAPGKGSDRYDDDLGISSSGGE